MHRSRYFEHLALLESDVVFYSSVKASALKRWRKDTPAGRGYSVLASLRITHRPTRELAKKLRPPLSADERTAAGHFADTDVVRGGLADTLVAVEQLDAEAVVFRTPAAFTPTVAHREAMARFFRDEVTADLRTRATLVWDPEGVWEDAEAYELATELGLVLARDPLAPEPPEIWGNVAYFRLTGLGQARRKFSDDQLEQLAYALEGMERAWVVFGNPDKYRDARRFKALLRT
jgi:uncharacterized protein YecE (DUF72 family)